MVEIVSPIIRLNTELGKGLSVTEAELLAKELGLAPLNLFMGLISVDRIADAVEYAESTKYESIYALARKIRNGTFVRDGKTYHLPKQTEPPRKSDWTIFLEMVEQSLFAEAVVFGRKSENEKVRLSAESLFSGTFTRQRDNFRIPPNPEATDRKLIGYFWFMYASKGDEAAYAWIKGVERLSWFKKAWDEGRLRHPDGSYLTPMTTVPTRSSKPADLMKARARKAERRERDRARGAQTKGVSHGYQHEGQKRGKKKG